MIETKVTRFLDREGVPYVRLPHSKQILTVEDAAAEQGVVAAEMVKSILLRDKSHNYAMACILGFAKLDPQAVRAFLGEPYRRLTFASGDEITEMTGYFKGAVNPLCLPESVPAVFDSLIGSTKRVNISSGNNLLGLELDAADLIR
ncbi:MAG: YbaK/EbsC family protein, partial [Chloroflexota bacterium]